MRPSPGVPDMSAAVIIMTRSGLAPRLRPPRWRLLTGRRCRGAACACHTSGLDRSVKAGVRRCDLRVWSVFFFSFLLNTKPSEERRPAVTQSWKAGLWNVLQEYPDSANSAVPAGSQLLMRLLTADLLSPPPPLKVRGRPGSLIRSPGAEQTK